VQAEGEAERNAKRDQLLDAQLAESRASAAAARRGQAEGVTVRVGRGSTDIVGVENNSQRKITDVTCKIVRTATGEVIREPDGSGTTTRTGPGQWAEPVNSERGGARIDVVAPGERGDFRIDLRQQIAGDLVVAWFFDDDGFRWHMDELRHLTATIGDEYIR
jgi:hypothetical protein